MESLSQIPQLPGRPTKSWQRYLLESLLAVGGSLAITGLIDVFHLYPAIPNISMAYLLLILALAGAYGFYAALLSSVVAFLSFDFFLVPPLYSFFIFRWSELLALLVFLVTALLTSQLAVMARNNIEQARLRERESWILYEVGRVINSTDRLDEQLQSIALALVRVFSAWGVRECALLIPNQDGQLSIEGEAPIRVEDFALTSEEKEVAQEVLSLGQVKDIRPDASTGQKTFLRLFPLKTAQQTLGVLCLRLERDASWFASERAVLETQGQPHEQAIFFWTFLDGAVMKIEQAHLRGSASASS